MNADTVLKELNESLQEIDERLDETRSNETPFMIVAKDSNGNERVYCICVDTEADMFGPMWMSSLLVRNKLEGVILYSEESAEHTVDIIHRTNKKMDDPRAIHWRAFLEARRTDLKKLIRHIKDSIDQHKAVQ